MARRNNRPRAQTRRIWRPFEQTIAPTIATTAGTGTTFTQYATSTLVTDLSGASISRRLILRGVRVKFAPFSLIGTTTVAAPQLNVQLQYQTVSGVAAPMTQILPLSTTKPTVLFFRVSRNLSQILSSSAGTVVLNVVVNNPAGAGSVTYNVYPTITSMWDMAEDSFA